MPRTELTWTTAKVGIACAVGMIVSLNPILNSTFSVYLLPITKEFHWGRAATSGALTIGIWSGAVAIPFVGRLLDRLGSRRVVLPGVALFSLAYMSMSRANGSLVRFYTLFLFLGISAAFSTVASYGTVISGWFNKQRGLALGLTLGLCSAIGNAIWPQIAQFFVARVGWRGAYLGIGGIMLAIAWPILALFLRDSPPDVGNNSTQELAVMTKRPISLLNRKKWGNKNMWLIIGAFCMVESVLPALKVHMVAMLVDRGLGQALAVSVLSCYALGNMIGSAVNGFLLDRFRTPRVTVLPLLIAILGLFLLQIGAGMTQFVIAALLMGIGNNSHITFLPYFITRYFGLSARGQIHGIVLFLGFLGLGIGTFAMGAVFDVTGSYRLALIGCETLLAVAVVFIYLLGPYAYKACESGESGPLQTANVAIDARV